MPCNACTLGEWVGNTAASRMQPALKQTSGERESTTWQHMRLRMQQYGDSQTTYQVVVDILRQSCKAYQVVATQQYNETGPTRDVSAQGYSLFNMLLDRLV